MWAPAGRLRRTSKVPPTRVGFFQRVTLGTGNTCCPVEDTLRSTFLPGLFQVVTDGIPEWVITRIPVKQAGMALLDSTMSTSENLMASFVVIGNSVAAL